MSNSNHSPAADRTELVQRQHECQVARDGLAALAQLRANCHGFTLDPFDDEYRRAVQRCVRSDQRLKETQNKLTVSPAARAFVPRLIQAIRAR